MVAWYLSVCLFIYCVFPMVLKKLQAAERVSQLLLGALAVACVQGAVAYVSYQYRTWEISDNFFKWMAYILPLSRAGDFIVGSAFGCIFIRRARETNTKSAVATLLELAAFGLVVFSLTQSTKELNLKWTGCATWYLPGSVLLVYSFAMHKGLVSKLLTNRLTVWLGDLSAYGFLFHQVIIRYLRILIPKITDADLSKVTCAFISFAVTVAASVIYKKYFADALAKPLYAAHARISDRLLGKPGEKAAR